MQTKSASKRGGVEGEDVLIVIEVFYDENKMWEKLERMEIEGSSYGIITKSENCIKLDSDRGEFRYQFGCIKDNLLITILADDVQITNSVMKQVITKIDGPLSLPKISDSKGGGCLIATATYGSELAPQVQQLRELRDNQLLQTESGTAFMSTFNDVYYSFSPIIADYERENPYFKDAVKLAITPMISSLSLMENANSESEVLSIGISVIALNLGMYLGIPAVLIVGIKKQF